MNNVKKGKSLKDLGKLMGQDSSKPRHHRGKIKTYFADKGYGFIRQDNGKDLFFHKSAVQEEGIPSEGDHVEYLIGEGKKGPVAKEVFVKKTGHESISKSKHEPLEWFCLPKDTKDIIDPADSENFFLSLNRFVEWDLKDRNSGGIKIPRDSLGKMIEKFSSWTIANSQTTRYKKLSQQLENAFHIYSFTAQADWRFIVGLGAENVHEASMTLHHIYGIPYIPGSALKGISRDAAIADLCSDAEDEEPAVMDALVSMPELSESDEVKHKDRIAEFGKVKYHNGEVNSPKANTINKIAKGWGKFKEAQKVFGGNKQAGEVVFFDAFPEECPKITLDIMNPHYPKYYSENEAPSDWQSPVPINFLTIENTTFNFTLALNKKEKEIELLNAAGNWLKKAIQEHGVGAKTSVGYGYFK